MVVHTQNYASSTTCVAHQTAYFDKLSNRQPFKRLQPLKQRSDKRRQPLNGEALNEVKRRRHINGFSHSNL